MEVKLPKRLVPSGDDSSLIRGYRDRGKNTLLSSQTYRQARHSQMLILGSLKI